MVGAIAARMFRGIYLNHLYVPNLDWLMKWLLIMALITVVVIYRVTNAIKILDDFNGLTSGAAEGMKVDHGRLVFRPSHQSRYSLDKPLAKCYATADRSIDNCALLNWVSIFRIGMSIVSGNCEHKI